MLWTSKYRISYPGRFSSRLDNIICQLSVHPHVLLQKLLVSSIRNLNFGALIQDKFEARRWQYEQTVISLRRHCRILARVLNDRSVTYCQHNLLIYIEYCCIRFDFLKMGKFRSKLKRHSKGKQWGHGQSATSNPEKKKHRNIAQHRFFKKNLSGNLITSTTKNNN